MTNIDLTGKRALITGGTRGIGRAISLTLASAGADIGAIYRSDEAAALKTLGELNENGAGSHFAIQSDISDENQAVSAARDAVSRFNSDIDYLVLDAAAVAGGPMTGMTTVDWKRPFEVNVHGAFYVIRECAPQIRPGGSIVFISSGAGHDPLENLSAYGASKAALNHLATILAQELGPKGIRVNVVSPGHTHTGEGDPNIEPDKMSDSQQRTVQGTALRRLGTAQDVANVVLFFVSNLSGFVTGQWVRVNGGRV
jgi:3-oxoacyl-[acyl-carrier protein] reductase